MISLHSGYEECAVLSATADCFIEFRAERVPQAAAHLLNPLHIVAKSTVSS